MTSPLKCAETTKQATSTLSRTKNGAKADDEACAAVGGFRDSTGATTTLKFQNNAPLKYIVELNKNDTLEFKIELGETDKIQQVRMLFGTIEEI